MVSIIRDERGNQQFRDRKKHEDRNNRDHAADGPDHKHVASDHPASGDALGEYEQECGCAYHRSVTHSELAVAQISKNQASPVKIPAANADGEPLKNQPPETEGTRDN